MSFSYRRRELQRSRLALVVAALLPFAAGAVDSEQARQLDRITVTAYHTATDVRGGQQDRYADQ